MTDDLQMGIRDLEPADLPLLFRAESVEFQSYTSRIGMHFSVKSNGRGIPVRGWRLADDGEIAVSTIDGAVLSIGLGVSAGGSPLALEELDVRVLDELESSVVWGQDVVGHSVNVGDAKQNQIWFGEQEAVRWVQLRDTDLVLGLDRFNKLTVLVFPTPVEVATTRTVTFSVDGKVHASAYGDKGFSIGVVPDIDGEEMLDSDANRDAPPACPIYEHLHSPDGAFSLTLRADGVLEGIDGPVTSVEQIDIPEAVTKTGELKATLHWPSPTITHVDVLDETHARIGIQFGDVSASQWFEVDAGLLVGIDDDGTLASIVAPAAEHIPQNHPFDDLFGDDHDTMVEQMQLQAAQHSAEEQSRAKRFVESRPFEALGLAEPPVATPRSIEARGSVWGSSDEIKGVSLKYGSEMEMFGEEPKRDLPLIIVSVGLDSDDAFLDPDHASQGASWLAHTSAMIASPLDGEQSTREMHQWVQSIETRGLELDAAFEPTNIKIDGATHAAEITRTDVGFVARLMVDDRFVVVRAVNVGHEPPALATVKDFDPFLEGLAAAMSHVEEMMRGVQENMDREPAPAEAQRTKRAVEKLGRQLQLAGETWGRPLRGVDVPSLFSDEVVAAWGGPDAFRSRFALYSGAVDISGGFVSTTDDGLVAHMTIRVGLPRPDGGSSIMLCMSGEPWWGESEEAVRTAASQQLNREQMPEHELELNALVERQDDGSYVIATDVLELIDQITGGLAELVRPTGG